MQSLKNEMMTPEMEQIRGMIIDTVIQRDAFKKDMELWYQSHPRQHYPKMNDLILVDSTLSKLDSFYKQLWDYYNASK